MYKRAHDVFPSAELTQDGRAAILTAIQDELRRTIDEKDFGVKQLHRIKTLAGQAQQMLGGALEAVDALSGSLQAGPAEILPLPEGAIQTGPTSYSSLSLTPAMFGENAGARLIQEILSYLKGLKSEAKTSHNPNQDLILAGLYDARKVAQETDDIAGINKIDKMILRYLEKLVKGSFDNQEIPS